MRISDWSSDVCSSDLIFETVDIDALKRCARDMPPKVDRARRGQFPAPPDMVVEEQPEPQQPARPQPVAIRQDEAQRMDDVRRDAPQRSDERRVGKEWCRTGRARGAPDHVKKKRKQK